MNLPRTLLWWSQRFLLFSCVLRPAAVGYQLSDLFLLFCWSNLIWKRKETLGAGKMQTHHKIT